MDSSTPIDDLQIISDETIPISEPGNPEEEMILLKTELGVLSASEVIYLVQGLKAQIKVLIVSAAGKRGTQVADSRDLYVAMNKIRDFANKVSALNGTIASMETQLMSLYGDRERLEQEIGAGEVEDVIAAFRSQQATILSMETQLSALYADREVLDGKLGRSEPEEIVSMFQSVTRLVQDAQRELAPAAA